MKNGRQSYLIVKALLCGAVLLACGSDLSHSTRPYMAFAAIAGPPAIRAVIPATDRIAQATSSRDILSQNGIGFPVNGLPINPFLWRASIEAMSALPLIETDVLSGMIVTDWYEVPEASGARYKLTVLVLASQLRADALSVKVFKQSFNAQQWRDVPVDSQTAATIEQIILYRARELFVAGADKADS